MTLDFFASLGCKFVALNGKIEADPNWQKRPLSADEIAPWRGNIGVIAGAASGGICWFDIDHRADLFLYRYPFLANSLTVRHDGNDHCKIAVRLNITKSHYLRAGKTLALTLLGDGFHAAVIGIHSSGFPYWHNGQHPMLLSQIEIDAIEFDWSQILNSEQIGKP